MTRYRAIVATGDTDAFGYAFTEETMDRLADQALGKDVWLMFTQVIGRVIGAGRGEAGVTVVLESDKELADLCVVPAFDNGKLDFFGLVPVPADRHLTPLEEIGE